MDKRQRQIDNWAQATRKVRQTITKNGGAKDVTSIVKALDKASNGNSIVDPAGLDHKKKSKN